MKAAGLLLIVVLSWPQTVMADLGDRFDLVCHGAKFSNSHHFGQPYDTRARIHEKGEPFSTRVRVDLALERFCYDRCREVREFGYFTNDDAGQVDTDKLSYQAPIGTGARGVEADVILTEVIDIALDDLKFSRTVSTGGCPDCVFMGHDLERETATCVVAPFTGLPHDRRDRDR